MNSNLDTLLMTCLDELDAGVPADQILARYPEQANAIRPILQLTSSLNTLAETPPPAARRQSADVFLAQADAMRRATKPHSVTRFRRFALAFAILVVLFVASLGIASNASAALPGDPLYPVKRAGEDVRLAIVSDPAQLQTELVDKRVQEVRQLLDFGREEEAEFYGVIESISQDAWLIGGVSVLVNESTRIEGTPVVGSYVEMEGVTRDGALVALEIELSQPEGPDDSDDSTIPAGFNDDDDLSDDLDAYDDDDDDASDDSDAYDDDDDDAGDDSDAYDDDDDDAGDDSDAYDDDDDDAGDDSDAYDDDDDDASDDSDAYDDDDDDANDDSDAYDDDDDDASDDSDAYDDDDDDTSDDDEEEDDD